MDSFEPTSSTSLEPKTSPEPEVARELVESICEQIEDANIFDIIDASLLERIGWVESRHGLDGEGDSAGGIWRVRKDLFTVTQILIGHTTLPRYLFRIEKVFGIEWSKVKWEQIRQPLHSALAASLILSINCARKSAPRHTVEEQGKFWMLHSYSTERKKFRPYQLLDHFISKVNERENQEGHVPFAFRHPTQRSRCRRYAFSSSTNSPVKSEGTKSSHGGKATKPGKAKMATELLPTRSVKIMESNTGGSSCDSLKYDKASLRAAGSQPVPNKSLVQSSKDPATDSFDSLKDTKARATAPEAVPTISAEEPSVHPAADSYADSITSRVMNAMTAIASVFNTDLEDMKWADQDYS